MPSMDRLGITVSLVTLGLALSLLIPLPPLEYPLIVLGSELTLRFSGPAQLAAILTPLVWGGVDAIMRSHPLVHDRHLAYTVTFWVLPSLVILASVILLQDLRWWGHQIMLIGFTGLALSVLIVSQYRSIDSSEGCYRAARLVLNAMAYVASLVLFTALYGSRVRSVVSATGVLVASSMFALELLRNTQGPIGRTWLYAILTGILMGELTWALNYCSIDGRVGGALLLLAFYTLTGLVQQYLWGSLTRRVVLEFGAVCTLGLAALAAFSKWFGS